MEQARENAELVRACQERVSQLDLSSFSLESKEFDWCELTKSDKDHFAVAYKFLRLYEIVHRVYFANFVTLHSVDTPWDTMTPLALNLMYKEAVEMRQNLRPAELYAMNRFCPEGFLALQGRNGRFIGKLTKTQKEAYIKKVEVPMAVMQGGHPRLGRDSPLRLLHVDLLVQLANGRFS